LKIKDMTSLKTIRIWATVLGFLAASLLVFAYKETILQWLHDDGYQHLPLLIAASVLLALIPVVPFGVIAGIMGAKFGPFIGGSLNVLISTTAAVIMFWLIRAAFHEQGRRFLAKHKRMDRWTTMMERNAFMAILSARLIAFIPAQAVNAFAAVSTIHPLTFTAATLIGKIPVMFVFATLGEQMFTDAGQMAWTSLLYLLFVLIVFGVHRIFAGRMLHK
jgi:uncharacterized membrane protein YdjX (TVP38/TMEM64 family)